MYNFIVHASNLILPYESLKMVQWTETRKVNILTQVFTKVCYT
jgi:hypothetical protein